MTIPHITIEQITAMNPYVSKRDHGILLEVENSLIDAYNEANAEQAQPEQYITAEEARKLGAGAEWLGATGTWYLCSEGCAYIDTWNNAVVKYRAIQAQPVVKNEYFQDPAGTIPAIEAQPEPVAPPAWTGSRDDVIALLNDLNVLRGGV